MSITNQSKPITSATNVDRPSEGETWTAIFTTWATETRTWLECSKLIDSESIPSTLIVNQAKP